MISRKSNSNIKNNSKLNILLMSKFLPIYQTMKMNILIMTMMNLMKMPIDLIRREIDVPRKTNQVMSMKFNKSKYLLNLLKSSNNNSNNNNNHNNNLNKLNRKGNKERLKKNRKMSKSATRGILVTNMNCTNKLNIKNTKKNCKRKQLLRRQVVLHLKTLLRFLLPHLMVFLILNNNNTNIITLIPTLQLLNQVNKLKANRN